jgi:plasmid stabilization system protein ParE
MRIEIKKRANTNIKKLVAYISDKGYPNTAEKYAARLYDFLFSLANHPNAYAICRNEKWAIKNYHCAIFEGAYVIPFKVKSNIVYVMNVVHGSKLK